VTVGFGFPLAWGILSGSMPRTGGEYVYSSRIIHTIVAIAESFGNALGMIFWVYVPAPWAAGRGPRHARRARRLEPARRFRQLHVPWRLSYNWGVFLIATALTILAFLTMAFSVTVFALIQKFVMSWRWAAQRWSRWQSPSTAGPGPRRTGTPWRPSTTR